MKFLRREFEFFSMMCQHEGYVDHKQRFRLFLIWFFASAWETCWPPSLHQVFCLHSPLSVLVAMACAETPYFFLKNNLVFPFTTSNYFFLSVNFHQFIVHKGQLKSCAFQFSSTTNKVFQFCVYFRDQHELAVHTVTVEIVV